MRLFRKRIDPVVIKRIDLAPENAVEMAKRQLLDSEAMAYRPNRYTPGWQDVRDVFSNNRIAQPPEPQSTVERSLARVRDQVLVAEQKKALLDKRVEEWKRSTGGYRSRTDVLGQALSPPRGDSNWFEARVAGVASLTTEQAEMLGLTKLDLLRRDWQYSCEKRVWLNPKAKKPFQHHLG